MAVSDTDIFYQFENEILSAQTMRDLMLSVDSKLPFNQHFLNTVKKQTRLISFKFRNSKEHTS